MVAIGLVEAIRRHDFTRDLCAASKSASLGCVQSHLVNSRHVYILDNVDLAELWPRVGWATLRPIRRPDGALEIDKPNKMKFDWCTHAIRKVVGIHNYQAALAKTGCAIDFDRGSAICIACPDRRIVDLKIVHPK